MRTDVIFNTDAASGLGRLPDNFIDCIVASPPYWQLRDYGLSPILFGGRQECEHDFDDYAICRSCGGWLGQLGQEPSISPPVAGVTAPGRRRKLQYSVNGEFAPPLMTRPVEKSRSLSFPRADISTWIVSKKSSDSTATIEED